MKPRIFSGVQPSGNLHIGNYLGAIQQWVQLQHEYEALFCIVDLHAITVAQNPEELRKRTFEIAKTYIALGIDPEKSHIFVQSHVKEHAELAWILNTLTKNGDLTKMTQFKDKSGIRDILPLIKEAHKYIERYIEIRSKFEEEFFSEGIKENIKSGQLSEKDYYKMFPSWLSNLIEATDNLQLSANEIGKAFAEDRKKENIGVGLFDYPVLMASDILLYDTNCVPVGDDQIQHLELTRTLARRFNKRFGETFVIPETRVLKDGSRIMGLDDARKKMSKSALSEYNYIALHDDLEVAKRKIMKAKTDSGSDITYSEDRPELKNLLTIFALLENVSLEEIVLRYKGKGYADFKKGLALTVFTFLETFQKKYAAISDEEVREVLYRGAEYASRIAQEKMKNVREKVGFWQ